MWDQVLPQAEFAYNDSTNRTTGKSPFQVVYGYHPRGVCELRELKNQEEISGHADDFAQSMREVHEQVKKSLIEATQRLKTKVDERRRDLQFEVGDLVMVHLNKARLQKGVPSKLQMRRIGPCKVLAKYGPNAYKIELPNNLAISPIFNIQDLVKYKGPNVMEEEHIIEVDKNIPEISIPLQTKPQAEKVLDSRVKKKTRHGIYMEHLVKWKNQPESEATWVAEHEFKKRGISQDLLNTDPP